MSNDYSARSATADLPQLTSQAPIWARQAGQIALHYFNHNNDIHYKADNTLLTRADVEIEQFLAAQIRAAYPDHHLLGEEGAAGQTASSSPYTWIIDPLDGTTAFTHGLPGWGIAIGLLHQAQPAFGLFYMPLLDDLTYTAEDEIYCNQRNRPQAVRPDWGRKGFLAVSSGAHKDFAINVQRTRAIGSAGASLIYTARGSATAAFIPKAYLWDLAAGAFILNRAGGELRYLSGQAVDFQPLLAGRLAPEPIIAGHPAILAELQGAIRSRVATTIKTL